MVKYKVYPTLLDEFQRFQKGIITLENMLNRINRIRDFSEEQLAKMNKGTRFEKVVLGEPNEEFDPRAIQEVQSLLPAQFQAQYLVKSIIGEVQLYGLADVVGERRVIDIKTTQVFSENRYKEGYQNLYLYMLKDQGCETMEYVVYDFQEVRHLVYRLEDLDIDRYLQGIKEFTQFLEEHRSEITDKRIFLPPTRLNLFD
jgi:hypothetical protein